MQQTSKPIKRSSQLAPLSRQHHEGLLFGWKLKQGISNGIDQSRIQAFLQWFWQHHLMPHFEKEEQALPQVLSATHPLIQQMLQEHAEIKKMVADIILHGDLKKFEILAQKLTCHIRFEERRLFGEVEKAASPEQLVLLETGLKDDEPKEAWEDAFWIIKK